MNALIKIRKELSRYLSRRLIPKEVTILSDDCWAGQLYRQINIPYQTPTVGLFIMPSDYLRYVTEFNALHQTELIFTETNANYPVAMLSGVEIHFMHFKNEDDVIQKYWRRFNRVNNNKILVKVDFGKPGYTKSHMEQWNALRIKNSLAFYPASMDLPKEGIYNGVAIPDWQLDGAAMFNITRKYFDVYKWVRTGVIKNGIVYRILNTLLFDPTVPQRIMNKIL